MSQFVEFSTYPSSIRSGSAFSDPIDREGKKWISDAAAALHPDWNTHVVKS